MNFQQYERLADELSTTPEYQSASDAGKAAMMRDLEDGLLVAEAHDAYYASQYPRLSEAEREKEE